MTLRNIIDDKTKNDKEKYCQEYLNKHRKILMGEFGCPKWFFNLVFPKFKFGSDYESDFIVIKGQSFSYWVELIELEPPSEKMFTKKGIYANRLNVAISQVNAWKDWIDRYDNDFRHLLQKKCQVEYPDFEESFYNTQRFIIRKNIVIGRRSDLSKEDNERRYMLRSEQMINTVTYDRLADFEDRISDYENNTRIVSPYWTEN